MTEWPVHARITGPVVMIGFGSIVGIAAVDALAWYFDLEKEPDTAKLIWVLAFPLTFAVCMLILAISDRLGRRSDKGRS